MDWLSKAGHHDGEQMAVAYSIRGERVPAERSIETLSGHRGSRPVRVGNAARDQRQLDVYGHILRAAAHGRRQLGMDLCEPHDMLVQAADSAASEWEEPDESIWEIRGGERHYLYSKVMCWAALECAMALHSERVLDGDVDSWRRASKELKETILTKGWSDELGAFTMTLDGDELDASALTIPVVALLPADDHRCRSTRRRVVEELGHRGLVQRYRTARGGDAQEGAFSPRLLLAGRLLHPRRPRQRGGGLQQCSGYRQ